MKPIRFSLALLLCGSTLLPATAQDKVTNAFEDLKRSGTVQEQDSPMRQRATPEQVAALRATLPEAGYFCFTEDRSRSVRMTDALPQSWTERSAEERATFAGNAAPGEFYTWQIALFSPDFSLDDIRLTFSDLRDRSTRGRIPADSIRCVNLGGIDLLGRPFTKRVDVPQGKVQSLCRRP